MENKKPDYFQDHMHGNVCFGCGKDNHEGLQIKSYWEENTSICEWQPEEKHNGWKGVLCGGVMAVLIDCHCICTAMAHAHQLENTAIDSDSGFITYATGTMTIKYLKPAFNDKAVVLKAYIKEVKGRKTVIGCDAYTDGVKTTEAEVIAIRISPTT